MSIYSAGFDETDNPREISRQGVPRAKQRAFEAMKRGVTKTNFFAGQADIDEAAAGSDELEGSRHRLRVARGVDHDFWQMAAGNLAQSGFQSLRGR